MALSSASKKNIKKLHEFDNHVEVFFLKDAKAGLDAVVAFHRKQAGVPSFGATRMMMYDSETEAIRDALRLSRGMSYKAALAGLPCGGAKGVIMFDSRSVKKETILKAYASKIAELNGSFVTGIDVGLQQQDLSTMKQNAKNIIGFNDNSTDFTGRGLCVALECCLKEIFGNKSTKGRSFAIQGLGKIGMEVLNLVYSNASKVIVSDINKETLKKIKEHYPKVHIISPDEIHKQKVDVFSPCALSSSLNFKTVGEIEAKIIVGGANNQLEDDAIGGILFEKGILYAPDYVANAGGLIAVFDEYEHSTYSKKRVERKVAKIGVTLQNIFRQSRKEGKPTNIVANEMAESIFNSYN